MSEAEETLQALTGAVCRGEEVPRHRLLWALGSRLVGHPVHLVPYAWERKPSALCPSESFGCHFPNGGGAYTGGKKGIEFHGAKWIPAYDHDVHSVNGCPNCKPGSFSMPAEERAKVSKACTEPLQMQHVDFLKITWTQLARYVDPALNDRELLEPMQDLMKERREARGAWEPWHYKHDRSKEELDAARDEWHARWLDIEARCRAAAQVVWDRALGVAIYKAVA